MQAGRPALYLGDGTTRVTASLRSPRAQPQAGTRLIPPPFQRGPVQNALRGDIPS